MGLEMHLLWRDYRSGDSGESNARKTVTLSLLTFTLVDKFGIALVVQKNALSNRVNPLPLGGEEVLFKQ